jgi:hypothetical protein
MLFIFLSQNCHKPSVFFIHPNLQVIHLHVLLNDDICKMMLKQRFVNVVFYNKNNNDKYCFKHNYILVQIEKSHMKICV